LCPFGASKYSENLSMNTGLLDINQTVLESYLSILNGTTLLNSKAGDISSKIFTSPNLSADSSAEPLQKSISIIPIKGPIQRENLLNRNNEVAFWGMDYISRMIDDCRDDESNHAIVMDFKSGGGFSNDPASVIASIIKYLSTGRKIYGSGDMACSAAYHIAVFCSAIYANSKSAIFGCMGTKWEGSNTTALDKKVGYINISVTADATPDKNAEFDQALNGKPGLLKDHLINPIADHFISDVKAQRPGIDPKMLRGATVTAELALASGMIDGIMSLSDIIEGITTDSLQAKVNSSAPKIISSTNLIPKNKAMNTFSFSGWIANVISGTNTPEMNAQAIENAAAFNNIKSEFETYKLSSETKIKGLEDSLATEKALRATDAQTIADLNSRLEKTTGTPPIQPADAQGDGQKPMENANKDLEMDEMDKDFHNEIKTSRSTKNLLDF
jgi:ClpP class serine protease